jgi:hypothetical protein
MKKFKSLLFALLAVSGFVHAQTAITWKRQIPIYADLTKQVATWADVAPDMTMPSGHYFVLNQNKLGWTLPQIFAKGVTHWTRGHVGDGQDASVRAQYPGMEYNNVPRTREIFGLNPTGPDITEGGYWKRWWPNGPYNQAQAIQKANESSLPSLWIAETTEGEDHMPESYPMWGWFYERLKERYEAQKAIDGRAYYVCHSYLYLGIGTVPDRGSAWALGQRSRTEHANMYTTDPSTWDRTQFHPGGTLSATNLFVITVYKPNPDELGDIIGGLFKMDLMKKLGKDTGVFIFGSHEWNPNWKKGITYPDGIYYKSDKALLDPVYHMAWAFLAQEYGKVFVEWGVYPFQDPDKKVDLNPGDEWWPNGATSAQPNFPHAGNQWSTGGGDLSYYGNLLWHQTAGQVASGTPYYARYRINGGNWVEKSSVGADLVDCWYEKRGFVRCRILGNKMAIMYYNPWADNTRKSIEIQHPLDASKVYTAVVSGAGIHSTLITL